MSALPNQSLVIERSRLPTTDEYAIAFTDPSVQRISGLEVAAKVVALYRARGGLRRDGRGPCALDVKKRAAASCSVLHPYVQA